MSKNIGILLAISIVLSVIVASFLGIDLSSSNGVGWVLGYGLGAVLISIILCGIPAGIYWLIKHKRMPGLNTAVRVVWALIFVLATLGNFLQKPLLEITIKKQNLVFSLMGAGIFVILGSLLVTGIIGAEEGAAEIDRIGGIVIGWVVIIFFGGLSVFAIISILKSGNEPVIFIDELGFFDRRVCTKSIPWSEIRSAHIFRGKTLYAIPIRFISLDVIEPDTYLIKGIDRYFPGLFKLLKILYDEPGITISTGLLMHSPEEILSAIEKESRGLVSIK